MSELNKFESLESKLTYEFHIYDVHRVQDHYKKIDSESFKIKLMNNFPNLL